MIEKELPLCECGCGERVSKVENRFISGHNRRSKKHSPESLILMSEITLQYHKDHPEAAEASSKRLIKRFSDPAEHDAQRDRLLQFNKSHPEAGKAHSEWMKQYFIDNPKIGEEHSKWLIQYFKDNPEVRKGMSEKRIKFLKSHPEELGKMLKVLSEYWSIQNNHETFSEIRLNSDAVKAEYEKMRGGNDIVKHHHIYDHNDLSKYTIKMTRSQHMSLHRNMQLLGIKVPHINTGHENEDELKLMEYIKRFIRFEVKNNNYDTRTIFQMRMRIDNISHPNGSRLETHTEEQK